jgi:hypothetical protein
LHYSYRKTYTPHKHLEPVVLKSAVVDKVVAFTLVLKYQHPQYSKTSLPSISKLEGCVAAAKLTVLLVLLARLTFTNFPAVSEAA